MTSSSRKPIPSGITLIEIVVAGAIFILIIGASAVLGITLLEKQEIDRATETIRSALAFAQGHTIAGTNDSGWGVAFFSDYIVLFQGVSYANRVPAFDHQTSFGGNVVISGPTEIDFIRPNGTPVAPAAVIITSGQRTTNVSINALGSISATY